MKTFRVKNIYVLLTRYPQNLYCAITVTYGWLVAASDNLFRALPYFNQELHP